MAYSLRIGNKTHFEEPDDPEDNRWGVADVELPEAPLFDDDGLTGRSNFRSPSNRGWHDFKRAVGLERLFNALMGGDPQSCVPLKSEHLNAVRDAIKNWKAAHPNTKPGFADGQDYQLARLLWLEWWMNWALNNCPEPTFYWD